MAASWEWKQLHTCTLMADQLSWQEEEEDKEEL